MAVMAEIVRVALPDGKLVSLCPDERSAVRERLLGRYAFSPDYVEALRLVAEIFPDSRVVEIREMK
jgi:hypothetical protein